MDNSNEKILIAIASYCDDELLNTVRSALIQADNPERIYFSICYQSDDLRDYEELKKIKNCKIKYLKESEAKGTCYARYLCKQMIEDEKYIFQIDSHMRFVKHYDSKLIEQILSLNDPNASISFYPPNCTEQMMRLKLDDKLFDKPGSGCVMRANRFRKDMFPFVEMESVLLNKNEESFKKNPFISAGNFFSFCNIYKKVLDDPKMFFYGDEFPMAIRYYTYGINNYSGKESYIYHKYVKTRRKFPVINNESQSEQKRFIQLLNLNNSKKTRNDIGEFGFGKQRSLKDFEKFAGIDFKNRRIYMNAELGDFERECFKNKISYLREREHEIYQKQLIKSKIEIIIIDLFGEYKKCVESCMNNANNKSDLRFIIGTTSDEIPIKNQKQIKRIVKFREDDSYTNILSKLSKYLSCGYAAIVDSGYRFLYGWDKYLCDTIKICGENAALTSWVWLATDENKAMELKPYNNIIKEFKCFNNYMPYLIYNEEIKLEQKKKPFQTPFISDGFLFCNSKILKSIKVDPNLTYREHERIYSLRLWTNGIDLFYPNVSYMYKTKSDELFNNDEHHYSVICALQGFNNYYSRHLEKDYPYDVGNKRTVWSWYDFMKFDYSSDDTFDL